MSKNFDFKVNKSKNGYELRTSILELAYGQLWQDYYAKLGEFEASMTKEGDQIVTTVTMPTVPGIETVLSAAEKFYEFVNKKD